MVGNHLIIPGGTRTIDATGKYIMPGGIDLNVHLQRPGFNTQTIDDFYQGTKAALSGGTTMVVDKVVPDKGETAKEAFVKWRKWADDKVGVRPSRGVGWLTKYLKK
ncbi:dihydropyrimidinase-related protein 3 [Eurytemora carolleeae]|uniref:dihydropyrimidinase-related protein 3 n=1 Tax=Eurytemora carolleeae TaxID=1294199 RepID=UPI000C76AA09|nr:dihydropyrimidinase-related protein 3 [Eurytemora carolleeae]|eukprot:XP_023323241.1 dihydropyrimidinase-related protein 3-like [Eurytemora affinis]